MITLASWLDGLETSPTVAIADRAIDLHERGRDIVALSTGAPAFETPDAVKQACTAAIRRGETRYTAAAGTSALRNAVRGKFRRDNGLDYGPDQIIVGDGAKHVIFNALMVSLDPGDEVIIPSPYYPSYPQITRIARGNPVVVACDAQTGYKLTAERLAGAITERTKWLVINSPGNPSGAVYSRSELASLAEVLHRHPRVGVISDDIYEHLRYDGVGFATMAALDSELYPRTLTVNGVSKAYGMTGFRIGFAGGPAHLIQAMVRLQSQSTTCPSSIGQAAAAAALEGDQAQVAEHRAVLQSRRDSLVRAMGAIPGFDCPRPQGALYAFPSCADLIGRSAPDGRRIESDVALARYLLEHGAVSVVPGEAFGLSPHVRVSFVHGEAYLQEGCRRMARACGALR